MQKRSVFIGILMLGLIFLQACGKENIYQVVDSSDELRIENLEDITQRSPVIVKGHFGRYIDKDNMVRQVSNPKEPSENSYTEGHIYEFHIDKVYKGDVDSTINVIIPYATEIKVQDSKGTHIGNVMNESAEYKKPDKDQSNILFLMDTQIQENLYGPASLPYNIVIDKDESIKFISNRIEGQLGDNVIDEKGTSKNAYILHEHRDDVLVDVREEINVIPNLLKGKTLSDVEKILKD